MNKDNQMSSVTHYVIFPVRHSLWDTSLQTVRLSVSCILLAICKMIDNTGATVLSSLVYYSLVNRF